MPTVSQQCPLCDNAAAYETVHDPDGKRFQCSECSEFFIDRCSEAYIASLVEVTKTDIRDKLKAGAQKCRKPDIYVIRGPRKEELGGDGRSVARANMIAECVNPMSSL